MNSTAPPIPRVLITAGPTWEPIDAVRYIGNRSSGKMGKAITESALRVGCPVTLLAGPIAQSNLPTYSNLTVERFQTADQLLASMSRHWHASDIVIMAAAVADYRPRHSSNCQKIRRNSNGLTLELEATPDILATLAPKKSDHQVVIGFALEARESLEKSARAKLVRKGLDGIVANSLETMDAASIDGCLLLRNGQAERPAGDGPLPKGVFADWLVDRAIGLWRVLGPAG